MTRIEIPGQEEMLEVQHIPFAPPRESIPGEGIYLQLWQEWAQENPDDWLHIFHDLNEPISQRVASIAASFMVFMGCNGGAGFTWEAERFQERHRFSNREQAFLAAWALENRRINAINHGLRTSEYMLCTKHPIEVSSGFVAGINWDLVPEISQNDNDALECMVVWWSTLPAMKMRKIAQPLIEAAKQKASSGLYKHLSAQVQA